MKKTIYLILSLMVGNLFAQDITLQKQFKLEYNLLGIGASYELPISEKLLLDFGAGVGGGVDSNEAYVWDFNTSLAAYVKVELKRFYNLDKRYKKGKNVANNAGNYVGLQTKYFTTRFSPNKDYDPLQNAILTEIHWGFQRNLSEKWLFNFHIGAGVLRNLDTNYGLLSPAIGLKFSYRLF
ncbi:hypothetical protein [uncultured Polaribacter sp.]|uniref:hypothetical protein n=1 Tax=uncultured Polaribacter sp. TaxID=174711 RepID=UPI0026352136|nr:hypothetical protein [uncultured Polaribacter sp.]